MNLSIPITKRDHLEAIRMSIWTARAPMTEAAQADPIDGTQTPGERPGKSYLAGGFVYLC